MDIKRRSLLRGLQAAVLLATARQAHAETTDLAVSCDTTLGPAIRAAGALYTARTGARIDVFPTPPGLVLPQLERQTQTDVVVTQLPTLEKAKQAGVIAPGSQSGPWLDRLVIAALRNAPAITPDTPIAASDPSPAADIDGPAVLMRLGLRSTPMLGAIDANGVAFLLTSGAAAAGLLHMTDVRADPRLTVIGPVSDQIQPPLEFAAAVTTLASRPNPARFVAFLGSSEATAILVANGLETTT